MVTGKITTPALSRSATAPALQELHLEQKELFDTIDALHALDIDKIVDLPQVVVVGNQSSGKSSVLGAISRVRFPTGSGICTRFPMELALRTDPQERIAVSIIPEKGKRRPLTSRASKEEIPAAIEEAKRELGIDKNTREIYRDILRIEIFAPDVPNLTLVDLPGLYCGESQRQSLRGRDVALGIAKQYMSQKRSIILAVISANTDISMDNAINLAKIHNVDPNLSRVLGTITQVDRIDRNKTETQEYLRIASGEDPTLLPRHGWHVLRNLSEEEVRSGLTEDDRDGKESEFFRKSTWKEYPSEDKGIPNLCKKLSMLLLKHISDSLPRVIKDIEEAIANRTVDMQKLGPPRIAVRDIRDYLHEIVRKFNTTAQQAIQGSYIDRSFFQPPGSKINQLATGSLHVRKLRALVRELNRAFTMTMHAKGHKFSIEWHDGQRTTGEYTYSPRDDVNSLVEQYYVHLKDPDKISEPVLKQHWAPRVVENRGYEFPGETNPLAMLEMFEEQSNSWKGLATDHLNLMVHVAKTFTEQLLLHILGSDMETYEKLIGSYVNPFFVKKKQMLESKLAEILPSSTEYEIAMEDWIEHQANSRYQNRINNQILHLENKVSELLTSHTIEPPGKKRDKIMSTLDYGRTYVSCLRDQLGEKHSDFSLEKAMDNMIVYYEASPYPAFFHRLTARLTRSLPQQHHLKHFTENVVILAVEKQLIRDIPEMLDPKVFGRMEDDALKALAGEAPRIRERRKTLASEKEELERGVDLCHKYRWRSGGGAGILPCHPPAKEEKVEITNGIKEEEL